MASYANIVIDQGTTFVTSIGVQDINSDGFDLSGYTAAGQIRRTYKSDTSYPFTANITDPTVGEITISMLDTETAAIKAGRYVYDIVVEAPTGEKYRVVEGLVEVTPSVTR